MAQVTREVEIKAPRTTVYEVIADLEKYPDFLSTTDKVEIDKSLNHLEAVFETNVVKPVRYRLKFEHKAPESFSWTLVESNIMKKNTGSWVLEKLADDRTKATYSVEVSFGWMVPSKIVEMLTTTQLPELLKSFKNRAEAKHKQP